jgi:hypothetical protein
MNNLYTKDVEKVNLISMFSGAACWQAWSGSKEQYTHKNMLYPLRNLKQQLQFIVILAQAAFPLSSFSSKNQADPMINGQDPLQTVPSFLQHNIFKRKIKTNH